MKYFVCLLTVQPKPRFETRTFIYEKVYASVYYEPISRLLEQDYKIFI